MLSDMGTIISADEMVHRAVRWIAEERKADPLANPVRLVQQASARFDLSPAAEAWLMEMLGRRDPESPFNP